MRTRVNVTLKKLIILTTLLCVQFFEIQASQWLEGSLEYKLLENEEYARIIYNNDDPDDDSIVIITQQEHLDRCIKSMPTANLKKYSTDIEIERFVFRNIVANFAKAVMFENDEMVYESSFQKVIGAMEAFQQLRKLKGDSTNYIKNLCNGAYTKKRPLYYAALHHQRTIIAQSLIAEGVDVNGLNERGKNPLNAVEERGKTPIAENMLLLLLNHGADPRQVSQWDQKRLALIDKDFRERIQNEHSARYSKENVDFMQHKQNSIQLRKSIIERGKKIE